MENSFRPYEDFTKVGLLVNQGPVQLSTTDSSLTEKLEIIVSHQNFFTLKIIYLKLILSIDNEETVQGKIVL